MIDRGLTHVALPVTDLDRSLSFYARYADFEVVHRRDDPPPGNRVAWISDGTRPFVVVLIEVEQVSSPLVPIAHLGVGCESRELVDERAKHAHEEGHAVWGPTDSPYPVGYWVLIADPDGHTLELSHGQEVGLAVAERFGSAPSAGPSAAGD
ncbi:MAG: VOC family protein [Myxococcota bacterium]|nr:VOC family protein [Myxococcota bacterium]